MDMVACQLSNKKKNQLSTAVTYQVSKWPLRVCITLENCVKRIIVAYSTVKETAAREKKPVSPVSKD